MLGRMSIAITEDHRALAATVSDFLVKHQSRAAARALLETDDEPNASFYKEAADLGWLGLHVPEELGGSGYGLEETVVVAEELGRALAPGAFTPTLITSAVLSAAGTDDVKARLLPGLADGSTLGATALGGDVVAQRREAVGLGRHRPRRRARRRAARAGRRRCRGRRRQGRRRHGRGAQEPRHDPPRRAASRSTARPATSSPAPAGRSPTSPARSSPPRPSASPARAPTSPPSTPRCACSSAGRSRCTRASSTTAPTWPSRPSWPPPRCGTPPGPPSGGGDQFTYAAAVAAVARRPGRQPVRQPRHAGARRHRLHVGARLPRVHAPGDGARSACSTPTRPRRDVVDMTRAGVTRDRTVDLPPEAELDPHRRAGVRRLARRARREGRHGQAHRVRLRDAALAEAVRAARPARSSSSSSSRSSPRPASSDRSSASPAGSS